MFRKGRERPNRGLLNSFTDLPEEKQKTFRNIKKNLDEYFKKDVNVYIAGSYLYGHWDELSDYDVSIDEIFNYKDLFNVMNNSSIKFHLVNKSIHVKNILIV